MQAQVLVPMLLLFAAGCARSDGTAPSATVAPANGAATSTSVATSAAEPASPARPAPAETNPEQATPGGGATQEGIRVGEPAPDAPRGPQRDEPEAAWRAFGNEPFWNVQARGGTLVFTTPDDQAGVTLSGRRVPSLVGTVILGTGPRGEFHLGITPGDCSDGMSDNTYRHAATFIYDGTTYKGCAEPVDAR